MHAIFVTGGTGYLGGHVIPRLLARGHRVRALARSGSEGRLPRGCELVFGDALDASTFADRVSPADTLLHLVGVAHPSPSKALQFIDIDLRSALQSIEAARRAGVDHFIYVSVAQPAPVMREYQAARAAGERALAEAKLRRTIVRPWYILGRGHRWPYLLLPMYWVLELVPGSRETARRLGLVTITQMVSALVEAVEHPPAVERIVDVPAIRQTRTSTPIVL